jgi:hypothetical protein
MLNEALISEQLAFADDDDAQEAFFDKGWTDGLPIVPPTAERVQAMIAGAGRSARDVIGKVPPRWAEATVENVAVNAVMAGCLPAHMPVLLTALEAACAEPFKLFSVQATTHPCGLAMIVSGPVAERLGMNAGFGIFGPGNRANAALGRAMRLVLMNIGGGIPGNGDQSTHGSPGKYTYCFAENEAASPWEPLRMSLGFAREDSTVTVMSAESPHNIDDHVCHSDMDILHTVASTMTTIGHNNACTIGAGDVMVVLGPEHAKTIAENGLTRRDVQAFLFNQARNRLGLLRERAQWEMFAWPSWIDKGDDGVLVPIVEKAEDIMVTVAGGAGKHSAFIPTFGAQKSVTRRIPPDAY